MSAHPEEILVRSPEFLDDLLVTIVVSGN